MHTYNPLLYHTPFGSMIQNRSWTAGSGYRFGFGGQYKDDEIKGEGNSIEYKYRIHDPRLGRFMSVDPLASAYPWNSTYAFAENKVIWAIELEGLEAYYTNDGVEIGQVGDDNTVRTIELSEGKNSLTKTEQISNLKQTVIEANGKGFKSEIANLNLNAVSKKLEPQSILEWDQFKYLQTAGSYIGLKEITGPKSNPVIDGFFDEIGEWAENYTDNTAWCAVFMKHCVNQNENPKIPYNKALNALSFSYSGYEEVDKPFYGSFMVRSDNGVFYKVGSTGHVATVVGKVNGAYALLGGNQAVPGERTGTTVNVILREHAWNYKYFHPIGVPKFRLGSSLFTPAENEPSMHLPGSDR